ncbi:hypothetical protein [Granulicella paludicola]|uniref:hypothetical protein n=1 Tax=Granulicella paludicola TaxID=474951 RepID=UPI0021DF4CC2|nr:hypothetical protein [Granulicella paludicola]
MTQQDGLWLAINGGILGQKIEYAIDRHGQFSYPIPQGDYHPRRAELVIVSLEGRKPDYLGISVRSKFGTTGQMNVMISNLISVERLSTAEIIASLPKRFRANFSPPLVGIYRPTPRLWEKLLSILIPDTPNNKIRMRALQRAFSEANRVGRRANDGGLEAFERDAIASALQAWGGPTVRRKVLRGAVPTDDERAPFLARLRDVISREDPQINHDHTVFPGMVISRRDIVSSVTLTDGSDQITILNCNRQPLERTLGVDLIYYSHKYKAFVLVQYKRMVDDNGIPTYRPHSDDNHEKELVRMRIAGQLLQALPQQNSVDTSGFRLNRAPFFIKLCEAKASIGLDSGMVAGMYLPLELWETLLSSPKVIGPKGGIVVTWENCTRRFSNGEFTNLLRNGWIGSSEGQTDKLSEIVEEVLDSGRMLILAATEPGQRSKDYRRDNWGRFSGEDDLESSF